MDYKGQHAWDKPLANIIVVSAAVAMVIYVGKKFQRKPKVDNQHKG